MRHRLAAVLLLPAQPAQLAQPCIKQLQGHALFTRQAGSTLPCPVIDLFEGFNGLMAVGFGITPTPGQTFQQAIAGRFGSVFGEL